MANTRIQSILSRGGAFLFFVLLAAGAGCRRTASVSAPAAAFPYGSSAFERFVQDSYDATGKGSPADFRNWMERSAGPRRASQPGHADPWADRLGALRDARARLTSPKAVTKADQRTAAALHAWIKKAIPRFSLDRGFEFSSVVRTGERQCLLQSVLLASLLQRSGARAGAVMVYRNPEGQESNLGHVVTLLKLPDGRDIMTDASDKTPFVRHTGLFLPVRGVGYRFVEPVFAKGSDEITGYRLVATGKTVPVSLADCLNPAYLRSQFAYYRGERTPGGLLARRPTKAGLEAEARWLRKSIEYCPDNPLATYMLGRVSLRAGHAREAGAMMDKAYALYRAAGWVPREVLTTRTNAHLAAQAAATRPAG